MLATIIGGAMFVGVQAYEYTHLVHHGFLPSGAREGSEVAELVASGVVPAATIGLYGSTFYTMTGFHGFQDRKSTRLNSSHSQISYAVFCLKKKNINSSPWP